MSEPSSGALRHALAEMSEEMAAARLPEDLWRRGQRRHRRRASAGIAASVLAVVLAVPLVGAVLERSPQQVLGVGPDGAVPARLYMPWMGLGTVQQSPRGRAALLVSGGGQLASAPDLPGTYGSRIAVVGRDGSYRMLRYGGMYKQAGQDVLLSPDGRYVAGDATLEALNPPARSSEVTVVDLMTGQVRRYRDLPAGQPVGWSPDASQLLLFQEPECPDDSVPAASGTTSNISRCELGNGALWRLDRASGRVRQLLDLSGVPVHRATFVAFAPDGRHLAVQVAQRLIVVDTVDGTSRTLAELGPRTRLAGAGAWSRDGASISVFTVDGCTSPCEWTDEQRWRLVRLSATTGAALPNGGFDTVTGAAVRIVGWQGDGDAVALRYLVERKNADNRLSEHSSQWSYTGYRDVGDIELLALHPGGGSTKLIETPKGLVWDLDVARDLIVDDRFGGPSKEPTMFPAAPWVYVLVTVPFVMIAILSLAIILVVRRGRRRRNGAAPTNGGRAAPDRYRRGG